MKKYLFLWLVNALVVYLAPFIAPGYVVLGNDKLDSLVASILSGILIVALMTLGMKLASLVTAFRKGSEALMGGVLLVVNVLSVWITARLAVYTGFGIASFWVAIALAVIVSALELWIWQMMGTSRREAFPVEPVGSLSKSARRRKSKKRRRT